VDMYTRVSGQYVSSLGLFLDVGETRKGLLVSSAWPGLPFAWPNHLQHGLGPANLTQRSTSYDSTYNDFREMRVRLRSGAEEIEVCPTNDMNMCADTDDAFFYEWAHYHGQASNRNVSIRDTAREQPAVVFSEVVTNVVDPFIAGFGTSSPSVSLVAPTNDAHFSSGSIVTMVCSYVVLGRQISNVQFTVAGPGETVVTNVSHEFLLPYPDTEQPGAYDWSVVVTDSEGDATTSETYTVHVDAAEEGEPGTLFSLR